MITLFLLFSCAIPTAQADDLQRNHGLVRVEFSDAVCFCTEGGDWHGTTVCWTTVSCIAKPLRTVETSK